MKICRSTRRATAALAPRLLVGGGGNDEDASGSGADDVTIGIVELNMSNPFFGTLQRAAEAAATARAAMG